MKFPQIRLGLVGKPATGKTYSALTFPKPVCFDADNGLTEHAGKDIVVIPFHSNDWICSYKDGKYKAKPPYSDPLRLNAALDWMREEAIKLEADQTLLVDSWSALQSAFDTQIWAIPYITKKGTSDEYAPWQIKLDKSREFCDILTSLRCHVVICMHEQQARDKDGKPIDKIAPYQQGQFALIFGRYFTDLFRCITKSDKQAIDGKDTRVSTQYFWQVKSDTQFEAKTRLHFPKEVVCVEPSFEIFKQYAAPTVDVAETKTTN